MRTVYLLRHAKSSWDDPSLPDIERPLAGRGQNAARRMGEYMRDNELIPDAVLCSSARRAVETWEGVRPALGPTKFHMAENLYMASPEIVLAWLRRLPADFSSVLVIGHNPTFEETARQLALEGHRKALARLHRKYPTAALAVIHFDVDDWRAVGWGGGHLDRFVRPKDL